MIYRLHPDYPELFPDPEGADPEGLVAVGGDLTGDGLINVSDLVEMRRAAISLTTLEGAWLKAATPVSGAALPGNEDLLQMRRVILEMADSMYD